MSINNERNIEHAYMKVAIDRAELTLKENELWELESELINRNINLIHDIDFMRRLNFLRWYVQKLTHNIRLGLIYANQLAENSGLNPEGILRVQNYAVPTYHEFQYFRTDITPGSPYQPYDIDFSTIPRVEINVNLNDKWDVLTNDIFVPGTDYYCITVDLPPEIARGKPLHSVEYYSIDALENWLRHSPWREGIRNYLKHPIYDLQISLENITCFTYRGPNQGPDQGGKLKYKRSYINRKKTKKSLKKRLYR
jgi:hypothetical protein